MRQRPPQEDLPAPLAPAPVWPISPVRLGAPPASTPCPSVSRHDALAPRAAAGPGLWVGGSRAPRQRWPPGAVLAAAAVPAGSSWRLPWERRAGERPPWAAALLSPGSRRTTLFFVKRHAAEEMQPLFVPAI